MFGNIIISENCLIRMFSAAVVLVSVCEHISTFVEFIFTFFVQEFSFWTRAENSLTALSCMVSIVDVITFYGYLDKPVRALHRV